MTVQLIVDASVAAKSLVREAGSDEAHALHAHDLHAPCWIRAEVGNTLRTLVAKERMSRADAAAAYDLFLDAPVTLHEFDAASMRGALNIGLRLGHPIYDCIYLALAIERETRLVTADGRFARDVRADGDLAGLGGATGGASVRRPKT